MARIQIDSERCKGCGLCVVHCRRELLFIQDVPNLIGDYPVGIRNPERCTGCLNCAVMCPDIVFTAEPSGKAE